MGYALHMESRFSPGDKLHYSSGNSHFLSVLIHKATSATPGEYANEHIFEPLGIQFHVQRNANFGFGYRWVVSERGGHLAFNADGSTHCWMS